MANSSDDDKTLSDLSARLDEIAMLRAAINSQLSPAVSPPAPETLSPPPPRRREQRGLHLVQPTPPTEGSNEGSPE